MKKLPAKRQRSTCRGVVLLLALLFMLLLALLATTVLQTAVLQLRMAANDQFLEEAFHQAQAVAAELALNGDNFFLDGGIGYTNCPVGMRHSTCDRSQLVAPVSAAAPVGVALDYRVIRQGPLVWRGFPIRESQDTASSSNSFDAAIFEIDVHLEGGEQRLGSAHIVQGIAVRVPAMR